MNSKKIWAVGLMMFLLSCLVIDFVADRERSRIAQVMQMSVSDSATKLVSQLQKELNSNVYLVSGLVAYINSEPELAEKRIRVALKSLYDFGSYLRNVGAAPGNRIAYVYPLAGNEKAIGLSYHDVPEQWLDVQRAIETRQTIVTDPIKLVQGGSGLVSRTPVFLADGSYWGILSLVMDFDSLLAGAGIAQDTKYLKLAMRSLAGDKDGGIPIMGDQALFSSNAVIQSIVIPGGQWQLAAMPANGWQVGQERVANMEGIAIAVALCFVLGLLRIQQTQRGIAIAKKRVEKILATTQDAIIVFDDAGCVSEANVAAERLFGYSKIELKNLNIRAFMRRNGDAGETIKSLLERSHNSPEPLSDFEAVKQNGIIVPLDITVGHTVMRGVKTYICAARDISSRKAAEAKLMEMAITDELTKVMNRRGVLKSASDIFLIARRYRRPLVVMMIDADHFKNINDTHGHDSGDKVLVTLAGCIKDSLRTSDLLGRFGGEEFLVVMPEAAIDDAVLVATRMLKRIRDLRVTTGADAEIKFTVSIGISNMDAATKELAEIIQLADTALYTAKNSGRDRYSVLAPVGEARPKKIASLAS